MATRNLFQSLTRSVQPVPPMEFILSLRKTYPQFGQTSRCREGGRAGRGLRSRGAWPGPAARPCLLAGRLPAPGGSAHVH